MTKTLAKTCINWDALDCTYRSPKAFIEALRRVVSNPEEHYLYSFMVDNDDEFFSDIVEHDYTISIGNVRALFTVSLGSLVRILKEVLPSQHHPQWDEITKVLLKDGFEYLLPGIQRRGDTYGYKGS